MTTQDILDEIDAATGGLCPCGAAVPAGSPTIYCGDDCRPTHIAADTDDSAAGTHPFATAMRWRPDLVSAAPDDNLLPLGSQTFYTGGFNAQMFERTDRARVWHLRLDDGHRFVGRDLDGVGDVDDELRDRVAETWRMLERELSNTRHLVGSGAGLPAGRPLWDEALAWMQRHMGSSVAPQDLVQPGGSLPRHMPPQPDYSIRHRPSDHTPHHWHLHEPPSAPAASGQVWIAPVGTDPDSDAWTDVGHTDGEGLIVEGAGEVTVGFDGSRAHFVLAFVRQVYGHLFLTSYQVAQLREYADWCAEDVIRRMRRPAESPAGRFNRHLGMSRHALELAETATCGESQHREEPPDHPMLQAIEARRNRNTGPPQRRRPPRRIDPRSSR